MTSSPGLASFEAEVVAKFFLQGRLDSKKSLCALIYESETALELPAEFLHEFRKTNGTAADLEFKKLRNSRNEQQKIHTFHDEFLELSDADDGSTTASCSSDDDRTQISSSTSTPWNAEAEISDHSCFEDTDNEMCNDGGKLGQVLGQKPSYKYTSFEPNQYVSSHLIHLLRTTCPGPKQGSGWRPRSAGSVQSCSGTTCPRPTSAPCRARPTSASSMQSGSTNFQEPVRVTLGSLSKSLKAMDCSPGSPKNGARKRESRPRSAVNGAPATCLGKPKEDKSPSVRDHLKFT
jgi:hypothetical protein